MKINQNFLKTIKPVLEKIRETTEGDFIVFGSAPLYLFGVYVFNDAGSLHDFDIVLDGKLKDERKAETVYFENDSGKKLYKISVDGMTVDIGLRWPGQEAWFLRIFKRAIVVEGFKFADIETILEYKKTNIKKYNREKDIAAVMSIEKFINSEKTYR